MDLEQVLARQYMPTANRVTGSGWESDQNHEPAYVHGKGGEQGHESWVTNRVPNGPK